LIFVWNNDVKREILSFSTTCILKYKRFQKMEEGDGKLLPLLSLFSEK